MTSSRIRRSIVSLTLLVLLLTASSSLAASISYPAHVAVYFSPGGGCTEVVVHALAAAHSHPYQRTTAGSVKGGEGGQTASTFQETPASQEMNGGTIHANRQSKIYHLPSCPGYTHLSAANLVTFRSETEAIEAGYRRAKNCR